MTTSATPTTPAPKPTDSNDATTSGGKPTPLDPDKDGGKPTPLDEPTS